MLDIKSTVTPQITIYQNNTNFGHVPNSRYSSSLPSPPACLKNMNQQPQQRINHVISTLQRYFPLLIIPAIAGLVLALIYAFLLMPETWTARQSFLIRDDLSGTAYKPGRFDSEESRKSAQETILEVARRPLVVRNVLEQLGPDSSMAGSNWITDEVIEDTQKEIDISAPNGAEFGKTDAIVLTAKASSRERTRKFIELLSAEIMTQTNRIRSLRFESMESELSQAYQAADRARDEAIDRLDELDQRLGSDFGFLSLQGGQPSGVEAIKSEILRKQDELEKAESVFAALLKAFDNPADVAQLPSEVLVAQPTLEKTMSKMIDLREQLHLAKGLLTNKHARVKALAKAIEFSQQQLYDSLTGEMAGVQADIALKKRQLTRLNNRIEELKARLVRLSKSRSERLALTTQVQQLGEAANRARTVWTETKSRAAAARTVGLITPTDVAQVSSRPDGIGKKTVALAGLFGGLMVGVGLILLVAPPMEPQLNSSPSGRASLASADRPTEATRVPQQRNSNSAGNPAPSGSFQHAASAMQSAADAMRIAASGETTGQQATPTPSPIASAAQPQPLQTPKQPTAQVPVQTTASPTQPPATNSRKTDADEAVRMAFQNQSSSNFPRDARAQPVSGQTSTGQANQRVTPKTNPTTKPNPFLTKKTDTKPAQPADTTQTTKANTVSAKTPDNVRPVDLAKSASVNNEFVRVSTSPGETPNSPASIDSKAQRTKTDSHVSKSARAIADTVSASRAANQSSLRESASTTVLDGDQQPDGSQTSGSERKPVGSEPFVVSANGDTSQPHTDIDQNLIDAIPDQIRKLSDSILKFGKDKK